MLTACTKERDDLIGCLKKWYDDPDYKERVALEYLNERSHFRQTGIKTQRYRHGKFLNRDVSKDGPALDEKGQYRPQKPTVRYFYFIQGVVL